MPVLFCSISIKVNLGGLICRILQCFTLCPIWYHPEFPKNRNHLWQTPGRSFDLCHFLLSQSDLCSFVFYSALQTSASKYVAELYEVAICCLNHINKNVFQQKQHLGSLVFVFFGGQELNGANDGKGLIVTCVFFRCLVQRRFFIPGVGKTNIHKDPLHGRISCLVSGDCVCEEEKAFVWVS